MTEPNYPDDWEAIALELKELVGWRCELCLKQCYRPGMVPTDPKKILSVQHLNHDPSDCRRENMVAACSCCRKDYIHRFERWKSRAKLRIKKRGK